MKKKFKKAVAVILTMAMAMSAGAPAFAMEETIEDDLQLCVQASQVIITDTKTGEKRELLVEPKVTKIEKMPSVLQANELEENAIEYYSAEVDVMVPLAFEPGEEGHDNYVYGVRVYGRAYFQTREVDGDKEIKVTRFTTSWVPDSNYYYLTNRYVRAHSGLVVGTHEVELYPTSNSVDYTTGWGWNTRCGGENAARLLATATVNIMDMSATKEIILNFTFGA